VTFPNPLAQDHRALALTGHAPDHAEERKVTKSRAWCEKEGNCTFWPFAITPHGQLGPQALTFLAFLSKCQATLDRPGKSDQTWWLSLFSTIAIRHAELIKVDWLHKVGLKLRNPLLFSSSLTLHSAAVELDSAVPGEGIAQSQPL
jgi:hypothetical protein